MHIAIDARELAGKPTGVGTYLAHLLREWERIPAAGAHRWTLYVPEGGRPRAARSGQPEGGTGEPAGVFGWRTVAGHAGTWWEQRALATAIRRDRPDVLFAPGYTAPLRPGVPVVLTIHDLSFVAHPEWFTAREGLRRRALTRWSARRARTILTISEFSRHEIVSRFGIPAARVHVIHPGISRPASPTSPDSRPPVVLYVGSIFNRRRVPDLMRAFAAVSATVPDARLEIVGDNRTHPRQDLEALARALGEARRVSLRAYVTDEELASLYATARVFAFLSEYEGFGFTPLEALAHRVPAVVLDTPVAREIYDDAALYVPRGDVAAAAAAIERLLVDTGLRATQLDRGQRVLERYCWEDAARRTLEAIERAGSRG
jgi:glycosyltransferase involved in cell wall biosynthesis